MRRFGFIPFILLIVLIVSTAAAVEQSELAGKLTRLHVIANSDSEADQALKLEVRDALLAAAPEICRGGRDEIVEGFLECARGELRSLGSDYGVSVELGRENYGTREYSSFVLPAGDYRSLRVTIGEGAGKNWWCVLFPPLCFSACEEFVAAAGDAGLTDDEISLITGDDKGYVVRFRFIELIEKLLNRLRGNGG